MSDNRVYLSLFGAPCRDWLSWMEWVEQAAQRVNLPLTYVGPDRVGKEIIKARRYSHRGLLRTIQKCELEALSFYSTEEEFTQLAFDWRFKAYYGVSDCALFFGCDSDNLSWKDLVELAPQLLGFVETSYGFGGQMHCRKGPAIDADGFGTSATTREEDGERGQWARELRQGRRFEQGYFRSVYPLNVLSLAHLRQSLGDRTLQGAIETGKLPGTLRVVRPAAALWVVEETDLEAARTLLREHKLILEP